jgi:hypothetical protein
VDHKYSHQLLERFSNLKVNGKQIVARLSEEGIGQEVTPSKKHRNFVDFKNAKSGDFKKKFKKTPSRY